MGMQDAIRFEFFRSSGPGGQNVNKVSTAARLRFDLSQSGLAEEVRARLARLAGRRCVQGIVIIEARRFRTQHQNRQDAQDRLSALVKKASHRPPVRRPTRPTQASRQRRLDAKKLQGRRKQQRSRPEHE